jgi:hypothetical protein
MKSTRPRSDEEIIEEEMIREGFHRSTPSEMKRYGKFVKQEGFFSILYGFLRQPMIRRRKWFTSEPVFAASRTTGSTFEPYHQPQDQPRTRQTVGVLIAGSKLPSGRSHIARLEECELQR